MNDKNSFIYLRALINYIPHYIFWKDKNSVFLGCNEIFAKTAGLSNPDDIIGKTDFDMPWGKTEAKSYRADDKLVMESRKPKLNIEEPQTNDLGQQIVLLTSKVPLFNENNQVIGLLGIYTDITKQKQIQRQLEIEKKRAEESNKAKSIFIANMSHDLRTPLSGIIGLAEVSQHQTQDKTIASVLENILTAGEQIMSVVDEILEVSSLGMDSNKLYCKANFYPYDLIHPVEESLRAAVAHKKISLSVHCDRQLPALYGADRIIHRILLNLVSNAIKFTAKGGVTVDITVINDPLQLQLTVSDTGIGIAKDQQQRIFGQFERLTPAYESNYPGSGLGLYLVKQFVDALHGSITVVSEPNKGATFTVAIPVDYAKGKISAKPIKKDIKSLFQANENKKTQSSTSNSHANLPEAATKKLHVLLVEDDALAQRVSKTVLEHFAHAHVTLADSSKMACKKVKTKQFDVIFMDVGLPDQDGIATADFIRTKASRNQSTPIIALSAHINAADKARCLKVGMQGILSKPLTRDKARTVIDTWVNNSHATADEPIIPDGQSSETTLDILDLAHTATLLGLSPNEVTPYYELLLTSLLEDRPAIAAAFDTHDWSSLRGRLHRMEGGFAYCKAPLLEKHCIGFHKPIKHDQPHPDTMRAELTALLSALDQTITAIETLVKS